MIIKGEQIIGFGSSSNGNIKFQAKDPVKGLVIAGEFWEATIEEVAHACQLASRAYSVFSNLDGATRADFLENIAAEILDLEDVLIHRAMAETALPEARLKGERGRTVNQLRLFAQLIREGSWVNAIIDPALPDRQPLPRADIRQMQIALGPVGIFGASNFPLAFSVAGGDTASALAAGCPIVVKAHPAHPGTSELVGKAIQKAAQECGMPDGVFSLLHGQGVEVGQAIVKAAEITAIGFTGSFRGGKAIFDSAAQRVEPIPVYAEMGSTNPVFILPKALQERGEEIAPGLCGSITLGVGQFCTNPGLTIVQSSESSKKFTNQLSGILQDATAGTMLTESIRAAYEQGINHLKSQSFVTSLSSGKSVETANPAKAALLHAAGRDFLTHPYVQEEVFGPSSLLITAENKKELLEIAQAMNGHLTATIHATDQDLLEYKELVDLLKTKVGRLIFNGYPTGVEVCHAMVHGGPFPATTDSRTTSVGTSAIYRFTRPICLQDCPEILLPDELKDSNPKGIWRIVNGERTK